MNMTIPEQMADRLSIAAQAGLGGAIDRAASTRGDGEARCDVDDRRLGLRAQLRQQPGAKRDRGVEIGANAARGVGNS